MRAKTTRHQLAGAWALVAALVYPVNASGADQHSVEAIIAALRSPISAEKIAEAREFDDQIMSHGTVEGGKVYLVTDERSTRVNTLVANLLVAAGEGPNDWVVRVLDSDPKIVNAFVVGGKYVYVYSGLLDQQPSDDELAFILGHELGHSLLKHQQRQENDASTTWAAIAGLAAALSEKNREALTTAAAAITNFYGRIDEEEADALAACIARRGGFDPLRGADFFTRGKREQDANRERLGVALAQGRADYDQALASCQKWQQWYKGSWLNQTQSNADKVNAICQVAENKRLHSNQIVEQYNAERVAERQNALLSTHPAEQSRVGTLAALSDFLAGRREASTLAKYEQTSRVITALQQESSELLKPVVAAAAATSPAASGTASTAGKTSLEEQLRQLKRALDQGLITQAEYEKKRQEILARY